MSAWRSFFLGVCVAAAETGDFLSLQRRLVEVFEENRDAVVRVKGAYEQSETGAEPEVILKIGTGFFISREGHILANATRTYGADRIWVEHRGIDYAAELLGSDTVNNISLLRLYTLPPDFAVIRMGQSPELPNLGTMAVAISYYLDFEAAPNIGLVQGYARRYGNSIFPTTFLRVSISNDLGEGGAPILDLNGRLIGMMIAALPDIRSSFVLPSRAVMRIRDDLLFEGEVKYSWIGIEVESEINLETNQVIVNDVIDGTPAVNAGVRPGDALLQVGEFPIRRVEDYPNASFFTRPGQFVSVRVERDGEILDFTMRVEARPKDEPLIVTNDPADVNPPVLIPGDAGSAPGLPDPSPRRKKEDEQPVVTDPDPTGPPDPDE